MRVLDIIKNKVLPLLLTILIIFSMTACGTTAPEVTVDTPADDPTDIPADDPPDAPADTPSDLPSDSSSELPQIEDIPVYPRTLQDMALREIILTKPVERIVSGYYISTTTIIALGVKDKIVGIEAGAEDRPIYSLAASELLSLPNVGTARDFNIEACLALEPDLVILPLRLRESADILSDMGVPVILVNPENIEGLYQMIMLIAIATECKDRGEELVNYIQAEISELSLVYVLSYCPLVFMSGNSTYLSTAGNEMYQAWLLDIGGGMNVASGIEGNSRQEISYEQLLSMNPDYFIIPPEASFDITEVTENPELSDLNAVKNKNVFQMPNAFEAWDSPIPSSFLGIKWLQCTFHSSLHSLDELRQSAFDFYKEFYDIEIDTSLIN